MSLKTDVAMMVLGLAEYYDKTLTDTQLDMYVEDLIEIPPPDLMRAIRLYRNDARNAFFPIPAKLKGMIVLPDDQRARDAVALVMTAIARIGNYRTKDAQEFIGELGWEVVKLQGGWEEVCRSVTDDNKGIIQAQWRELAISLINKNRLGMRDEKPTLEFKPKGNPELDKLSDLVKLKVLPR